MLAPPGFNLALVGLQPAPVGIGFATVGTLPAPNSSSPAPAGTLLRGVQTRPAPYNFQPAPAATVRAPTGAAFAPGQTDPDGAKKTLDRIPIFLKIANESINRKVTNMNQDQFNITGTQTTLTDYLLQNKSVWSNVKAINDTVNAIMANNKIISDKANVQEHATDGAVELKRQARHDLEEKVVEIADQLFSLADKTNNTALEAQVHLTLSSVDGLEDADLERTAGNILQLATTNLAALADYNLVQADLDALDSLAKNFTKFKTAPRTGIAKRKGQTDTLPQAIDDNQSLIRRQLDKQMTKFKKTNPEFYAGYQAARLIVSRRSHHKPVTTTTTSQNTPQGQPTASK